MPYYKAAWSTHHERADQNEARIDADHYRVWAKNSGYSNTDVTKAHAEDVWTYLTNFNIPFTTAHGELSMVEQANLEVTPWATSTDELIELLHPNPWAEADRAEDAARGQREFLDKRQSLAMFLLAMATGMTWDDAEGVDDLHDNYTMDAEDVLRANPHLLGLSARKEMGIE